MRECIQKTWLCKHCVPWLETYNLPSHRLTWNPPHAARPLVPCSWDEYCGHSKHTFVNVHVYSVQSGGPLLGETVYMWIFVFWFKVNQEDANLFWVPLLF